MSVFDRFTEEVRQVLTGAQNEAQRLNHSYIGTEHILLGLTQKRGVIAAKILIGLGVNLKEVRDSVEFIIGYGDSPKVTEMAQLTPRSKKVIELAVDEARRLNHHYIGTEHLLLGLMREGEGVAFGVLESFGVTLEKVRTEYQRKKWELERMQRSRTRSAEAESRSPNLFDAISRFCSLSGEDQRLVLSHIVSILGRGQGVGTKSMIIRAKTSKALEAQLDGRVKLGWEVAAIVRRPSSFRVILAEKRRC